MKLLFFGTLSSLVFLSVACEKKNPNDQETIIIERNRYDLYVYRNELDVPVKIDYYKDVFLKTEMIESGGSLTERTGLLWGGMHVLRSNGEWEWAGLTGVSSCDSVKLRFGDTKELWFCANECFSLIEPESVYMRDNYVTSKNSEPESEYESTFTYTIGQEIYDLATDIVNEE